MTVRCSACGEENPARARFCLACGTPVRRAGEEGDGPRASRRTLTVLFADVVGFTSLGERLDSESLRGVMDRFYAEMRQAVEGQGGTVAKFIGDAVMAVWGTPEVHEDDALRAVRAADDMRAALRRLNDDLDRRWGVRIGLRTGVNTGEVVVDPAQRVDLLVGDTLNVAARLEQAAGDGDVLVGPDTARLVRHEADLEPIAPLRLKGKSRPLTAWRLRSARPGDRPRTPRLQAPLVGREREVAHLRSAFYGAVGARETRLITVIGSPGIGKSRLVADFTAGVAEEARVLSSRCEQAAEGATFHPLAEVVRAAAGVDDGDDAQTAQAKLAATLPAGAERALVAERAAGIAGLGPEVGVEETFWAFRRLLEGLAAEQPVVLVVDDLQWAQPTLLDLYEHLARWGRGAPVLIVAVARPELRELRQALTTPGGVAMDVIQLEPLGAEAGRTLVDRLLGDARVPDGLAERVLAATGGNPLFLGETLRMLVDEGVLRREDGEWVVEEGAQVAVPPTIHALLSARVERLPPAERRVVECAAVIGQQFARGAISDLLGPGARDGLDDCLEALRRKELIAREPGAAPADGPLYRFSHVLIRDAAYRSLLKEARVDLHQRYAHRLAGRPGDHDAVIGFHLERAHAYRQELGPLDEEGHALGRQAADRLRAAASRALLREDLRTSADLLERALSALDTGDRDRRIAILLDLAEALLSAGDTARGQPVVERLILLAQDDERLEAWATVFACQLSNLAGGEHVRETIGRVRRAAGALARLGDAAGEAKAFHVAAGAHASLGQVAAAEVALDRALVAARAAGDRRRVTAVLSGAPRAALWGPSPIVRASGRCLDVVRILRMTPGNRHVEAAALRCQAVLEAMRGRADAARRIVADCRATLEELGLTYELLELAAYAGIVELLAGDPAAAERELRQAKEGFAALGAESGAALSAALLARALLDQGRDDEAEGETRFAELRGGEDLKTAITWHGARAEALARRGEHEAALALARRAVELAEPTDALADKADALMALAAVLRAAGREDEARRAATDARELYADKEHDVGRRRAEAAAGLEPAPAAGTPRFGVVAFREQDPAAAAVLETWTRLVNARDYDALRATFGPDYVIHDLRRAGGQGVLHGPDRGVETARSVNDAGHDVRWDMRVVAGRRDGDAMVAAGLCRVTGRFAGTDGEFVGDFGIVVVAGDALTRRATVLDADDAAVLDAYDEACAEVFGGPAAGAPSGSTRVERVRAAAVACVNEGRWDDLRDLHAEEVVLVDHRALGQEPVRGRDAVVEALRGIRAVVPDVVWDDHVVATSGEEVALAVTDFTGHVPGGGAVEAVVWQIMLADPDGRIRRTELFDDEAGARRRMEVLGAWCRGVEAAARQLSARDWSRARARYSPQLLFADHRAGLRDSRRGVEAFWEATFTSTEELEVTITLLDARTMRLGAARMRMEGAAEHGGRFEGEFDQALEVDGDGRVVRVELFDVGDPALEQRLDELERGAAAAAPPA
jgi:class 3 adenylate cyclase/tetratricopeptide (TPR) repeat protein